VSFVLVLHMKIGVAVVVVGLLSWVVPLPILYI
jgi:hypothetical protein